MNEHIPSSIKFWAEDDRPREKLLKRGPHILSNSELLAILIGSGTRSISAVDLSKNILEQCQNNLIEFSKLNVHQLKKFKGIGSTKAISLIAALELGKRAHQSEALMRKEIGDSQSAYKFLKSTYFNVQLEQAWVIYLNNRNSILAIECVSSGGITATVIDPRIVFKKAFELNATRLILSHNHPSGTLKPSDADIELTKRIKLGGEQLSIQLLDHIIISDKGYYSFSDEGIL